MHCWCLRTGLSVSFAVTAVLASERVTSFRSRLFRHPDNIHNQHEEHLAHGRHSVTLHGPRHTLLSDRSRIADHELDLNHLGNFLPIDDHVGSRLDFRPASLAMDESRRAGLALDETYRSSGFIDVPSFAQLATGMALMNGIQDASSSAPVQGQPFVIGTQGADSCPTGTVPINDVTTCQSAAQYLVKNWDGTDSKVDRPPGCYMAGDNTGVNLNEDQGGHANPAASPVCQAAMPEAPSAPVGAPASSEPAPAPAPPRPPENDGGCGGSGCGGCDGSGCGQSWTTLIPIPLVPQWPVPTVSVAPIAFAPTTAAVPPSTTATVPAVNASEPEPTTTAMPTATATVTIAAMPTTTATITATAINATAPAGTLFQEPALMFTSDLMAQMEPAPIDYVNSWKAMAPA